MSNLLEKASILLTPTAYDDGKILSVKPEEVLGEELVVNGDFATDSDWNLGTGWSIVDNKAISDATQGYISQTNVGAAGVTATYKVQWTQNITAGARLRFFARNYNDSGNATILSLTRDDGVVVGGGNCEGSGTFTGYISTTNGYSFKILAETGVEADITNVSVKEAIDGDFDFTRDTIATRVNSQGLIEDITNNLPRIDYSPYSGAGTCGQWLFEPQSTNLFSYSDASSGFTKTKVTISNNQGTSPDGSNNATKMLMTSGTGAHRVYEAISSSLNDNNTFSVFIKEQSEVSHIGLTAKTAGTIVAWFSGSDGSIINANGLDAKTQSFANGWHRISISYVSNDTLAADNQFVYFSNRENTGANPGFNGTETVLMYGFQVEKLSYATSYIPTNGGANGATRFQDLALGAGNSSLINSTEGVLYAEIAALANQLTHRRISISDGTLSNLVYISFDTASNSILANANGKIMTYTVSDETEFQKVAVYYNTTAPKLFVNGVLRETETAMNAIIGLNELAFDNGIGADNFFGKTKCVAVFKEALTDAELTCLTTI